MPRRPAATLVKDITKFHEFEFHIMRGRTESSILVDLDIDLSKTLPYLEKVNKGLEKKSVAQDETGEPRYGEPRPAF